MSRKKVIYYGFAENKKYIVDQLHNKHNWDPVMFVEWSEVADWSELAYPNSIYSSSTSLRKARFNYDLIGNAVPIDSLIIDKLSKYSLNVMSLAEDSSGWNYSIFERRDFYYSILKYWNTVINTLKPDIIIWSSWPHTISCYSLYLLSKNYYSIDVIFIDPMPMLDKDYHVIGTSLENPCLPFYELYDSDSPLKTGKDAMDYINKSRAGVTPKHITDDYEKGDLVPSGFRWAEFLKLCASTCFKATGFKESPRAIKKNRKPFWSADSYFSNFEYFFYEERRRNRNRRLKKIYDSLSVKPDMTTKFIYYAAAYQPEARTNTNCGVYEDQFLSIDILSAVLPENWVIYYKENAYTFDSSPWSKGSEKRDKYYFTRLNSYENVELIPSDTDTFNLIDNSQAVASLGGTVSWEAIVRGKPAFTFGASWFMACKSIFRIESLADARVAMDKILSGYVPNQSDIERYATAIEMTGTKKMLHRDYHENIVKCSQPEREMDRIVEAIMKAYKDVY